MTLLQIIELHKGKLKEPVTIEYRMMLIDEDGLMRDFGLMGYCKYENGVLISMDGDTYDLLDDLDAHAIDKDGYLLVWYDVTSSVSGKVPLSENPSIEGSFGAVDKHIVPCTKRA